MNFNQVLFLFYFSRFSSFTARRSNAGAVFRVVILSIRPFVCLSGTGVLCDN